MAGQGTGNQLQLRVPGLAGVDQVTADWHRVRQAREGVANPLVVGEQFVQTGHHGEGRLRVEGRQVGAVEGIALDEAGDVFQALLANQGTAVAHIDVAVVTQHD